MSPPLKYLSTPLERVPYLRDFESRFDFSAAKSWLYNNWLWTLPLCLLYVALVFSGKKWMSTRPPYDLRRVLFAWNLFLAIFSIIGSTCLVPHLLDILLRSGLTESVCKTEALYNPHISLWCFVFTLSKVLELGDTAFVILRKSPLQFLHWYHHCTVLVYSFYGLGRPVSSAIGIWFGSMNYSVHAAMYSYYAIKALGYRVPSAVSRCITIFQLSQMVVALVINFTAFRSYSFGEACEIDINVFYAGMIIYGSYAILFANFFYQRYIKASPKTKRD
uniref:Elongation of very long chain fatty acids protein n=1 Tax=Amphimedon queenslandica TaxID=400682 RepID=A0A1X7UY41_AMPQE